jgi:hypothetical protein
VIPHLAHATGVVVGEPLRPAGRVGHPLLLEVAGRIVLTRFVAHAQQAMAVGGIAIVRGPEGIARRLAAARFALRDPFACGQAVAVNSPSCAQMKAPH